MAFRHFEYKKVYGHQDSHPLIARLSTALFDYCHVNKVAIIVIGLTHLVIN